MDFVHQCDLQLVFCVCWFRNHAQRRKNLTNVLKAKCFLFSVLQKHINLAGPWQLGAVQQVTLTSLPSRIRSLRWEITGDKFRLGKRIKYDQSAWGRALTEHHISSWHHSAHPLRDTMHLLRGDPAGKGAIEMLHVATLLVAGVVKEPVKQFCWVLHPVQIHQKTCLGRIYVPMKSK